MRQCWRRALCSHYSRSSALRVLGLSPSEGSGSLDTGAVKAAYKKACKRFHPDLNQGAGLDMAEAKLKSVNAAYAFLLSDDTAGRGSPAARSGSSSRYRPGEAGSGDSGGTWAGGTGFDGGLGQGRGSGLGRYRSGKRRGLSDNARMAFSGSAFVVFAVWYVYMINKDKTHDSKEKHHQHQLGSSGKVRQRPRHWTELADGGNGQASDRGASTVPLSTVATAATAAAAAADDDDDDRMSQRATNNTLRQIVRSKNEGGT